MKESKLLKIKELADSLGIRDNEIQKAVCLKIESKFQKINKIFKDDSLSESKKLENIKQIIDKCQQEMIKMAGTNILS